MASAPCYYSRGTEGDRVKRNLEHKCDKMPSDISIIRMSGTDGKDLVECWKLMRGVDNVTDHIIVCPFCGEYLPLQYDDVEYSVMTMVEFSNEWNRAFMSGRNKQMWDVADRLTQLAGKEFSRKNDERAKFLRRLAEDFEIEAGDMDSELQDRYGVDPGIEEE